MRYTNLINNKERLTVKDKFLYGLVYTLSLIAGFILFFAERKYKQKHGKEKRNIVVNKS